MLYEAPERWKKPSIFMSLLLPLKGPDSTEEELGLTDVSKGMLLLDAILGKNIVML